MNDDEVLTTEEVAQIMKTGIKTVSGWVQSDKLVHVPLENGSIGLLGEDNKVFFSLKKDN